MSTRRVVRTKKGMDTMALEMTTVAIAKVMKLMLDERKSRIMEFDRKGRCEKKQERHETR